MYFLINSDMELYCILAEISDIILKKMKRNAEI
jgi:hypothetical protein